MRTSRGMSPATWAIFLVDDGLNYWTEWGERGLFGEDGKVAWKMPSHASLVVPDDLEFRTEVCSPSFGAYVWNGFRGGPEVYRVYRTHVGDMQAWSWSSLPGVRLDESVISHFVNGQYAASELRHLEQEAKPMELKTIMMIVGAAIVVLGVLYFVVLPRFQTHKAPVVPEEETPIVTPGTPQPGGHWEYHGDGSATWVIP